jgi:hypothetical protein
MTIAFPSSTAFLMFALERFGLFRRAGWLPGLIPGIERRRNGLERLDATLRTIPGLCAGAAWVALCREASSLREWSPVPA